MKIRTLLLWGCILLILAVGLYLSWGFLYGPHLASTDLPALLPEAPLAYLRCSDLQTHLTQFSASELSHQFLNSPFFKHLHATEEWQEFSVSLKKIWNNLFFDPMRLVGSDVVIGLYKSSPEDLFPPVSLLSRVDGTARIAERFLYAFDRLSGRQIGIQFVQHINRVPVYRIKNADLLLPFYYAIIDEVAMLATSLPLLRETIQTGLGRKRDIAERSESRQSMAAHPLLHSSGNDSRFLTAYLEIPSLLQEFSISPFWRSLLSPQDLESWRGLPPVSLALDRRDHALLVHSRIAAGTVATTALFQESKQGAEQLEANRTNGCTVNSDMADLPLFLHVDNRTLTKFWRTWQASVPQQQSDMPIAPDVIQLFGKQLECRLSQELLGTVYAVPDILCTADPQYASSRVVSELYAFVEMILEQNVPPMVRHTILKHRVKEQGETAIGQMEAMFQPFLTYTAWPLGEQRSLAFVTTNASRVEKQLSTLTTDPKTVPFFCQRPTENTRNDSASEGKRMAAQVFIHSVRFGEFLDTLSDTRTFRLLVPQEEYASLYEWLPEIVLIFRSLPPIVFELGLQKQELFAALQIGLEFPE